MIEVKKFKKSATSLNKRKSEKCPVDGFLFHTSALLQWNVERDKKRAGKRLSMTSETSQSSPINGSVNTTTWLMGSNWLLNDFPSYSITSLRHCHVASRIVSYKPSTQDQHEAITVQEIGIAFFFFSFLFLCWPINGLNGGVWGGKLRRFLFGSCSSPMIQAFYRPCTNPHSIPLQFSSMC